MDIRKRVGIYVPTHDQRVPVRYAHHQIPREILGLINAGYQPAMMESSSCDLIQQRNAAVEDARAQGMAFLCMVDSDVYAPAQAALTRLVQLCAEKDAAMTAANVGLRRFEQHRRQANVKPFEPGSVYEIEECGTGMVCINLAELDRIAAEYDGPWFARTYKDKRCSQPDVGMDIFFSRLLRAYGGSIWADTTLETVHAYTDHHTLYYGGELEAVTEPLV